MRREEYLHTLTEQIRCKMARGTIEQEINDHIEDQKEEFLSEGMSQTEAEEAAVREMGDPVEVGLEMDRIHRPTMAWGMIALIVGLSLAGYLLRSVMYQTALGIEQSAGKTEELFWTGMSSSWHTSLELPALLIGLVLMIGICYMDYTRIAAYAKPSLIAYQVLLLVGLQVVGAQVNGSTRYIIMPFGNFGLNLTDLLWLTIPLFAAVLYSYRGQGYRGILKAILWMVIPTYFLIIRSQSLIGAMILEVVYCVVLAAFMARGALYWYLLILWNDFIISIFIPSEPEKTDSRTKELIYKNIMIPVVLILNAVYFENALDKENIQIVYAVLIAGFIGLVQLPLFIWYAGRVKSHIRSAVFYRTNIDVSRVL